MYNIPVVGDTYFDTEQRSFNLAYFDGFQVLLNPDSMLGTESGLHLTEDKFKEKVINGEFIPSYSLNNIVSKPTDFQKKESKKRKPYMVELALLVKQGCSPTTDKTINKLKNIVHDKYHIGTSKHGNSSIARWWKDYSAADYILEQSISPIKKQPKRLSLASENFLNSYFTDVWVKGSIENTTAGYNKYKKALENSESQNESIELISEATFRRRVKGLNAFNVILNSGNYSEVKKALRTLCKKIKTTRVLERVEMDRMALNMALIDEDGQPTGNVSIYIAIDCYSRYPLSVTFELGVAEDTEGVIRSFKRIFTKTSDALNAHGIPVKVIVDNGSGYKSDHFKQVVKRVGADLIKAPSNEGWRKPFVESFIKTLREELFKGGDYEVSKGIFRSGLPGYNTKRTSNSTKPPSDKTIKKSAALTIEEFASILHDYLVLYVTEPHSGLNNKTPQQVWNESIAKIPLIPVNEKLLNAACHYAEVSPKLGSRGTVRVDKQDFFDGRLKQCYLDAKNIDNEQNMHVTVKYDPDDGRWVTVIVDFANFDKPRIIERAENRALSGKELEYPQSFEELNAKSAPPVRRDIFCRKIHTLIKQTTRPHSSGKAIESANKNASKSLNVAEKIKQSNESNAFKTTNQTKKKNNQDDIDKSTSEMNRKRNKDLRVNQQTFLWDE